MVTEQENGGGAGKVSTSGIMQVLSPDQAELTLKGIP